MHRPSAPKAQVERHVDKRSGKRVKKAAAQPRRARRPDREPADRHSLRVGRREPRPGFDCSGLVQYVYSRIGISVPVPVTYQQWGCRPPFRGAHLRPGDLVFFHSRGHVGIYAGRRQVHPCAPRGLDRGNLVVRREFVGALHAILDLVGRQHRCPWVPPSHPGSCAC